MAAEIENRFFDIYINQMQNLYGKNFLIYITAVCTFFIVCVLMSAMMPV